MKNRTKKNSAVVKKFKSISGGSVGVIISVDKAQQATCNYFEDKKHFYPGGGNRNQSEKFQSVDEKKKKRSVTCYKYDFHRGGLQTI